MKLESFYTLAFNSITPSSSGITPPLSGEIARPFLTTPEMQA
jgi:hypothetical protein